MIFLKGTSSVRKLDQIVNFLFFYIYFILDFSKVNSIFKLSLFLQYILKNGTQSHGYTVFVLLVFNQ